MLHISQQGDSQDWTIANCAKMNKNSLLRSRYVNHLVNSREPFFFFSNILLIITFDTFDELTKFKTSDQLARFWSFGRGEDCNENVEREIPM